MKIVKYSIVLGLISLMNLTIMGQEELDNYLITAAQNNPNLKAKFSEYRAALERVPQVGALPDPQLMFGYLIQPVETRVGPQQARISASQMFPWFGTLSAQEEVAIEMAKATYEVFAEARSRLFYEIKSTWYNLYFTGRAIDITRENIEILNTFQKLSLVKIESGEASAVDELRVEMEILDLENQLNLLLDNYQALKVAFNNLLHVEESKEIYIPDLLSTSEVGLERKTVLDSIRKNNHQVLNLEFQEVSFEYQQRVAKKMARPSFSLGVNYIFIGESSNPSLPASESGNDAIILPTVGIKIPLYRKKYSAMVKEAIYRKEATQHQKADKVDVLETVYEKSNTNYQDAKRRIMLHTKQLELARKALRILESEYATNGKNFEEILRMERQVLMHGLELEKSRADLNASIAFINYLMGK